MSKDRDLFQHAQVEKSPDGGDYRQGTYYTESARSKTVKAYFMMSQSNKFGF